MKICNRKISYGEDRINKINKDVDNLAHFYIPEAKSFIEINRSYILDNYTSLFKDINKDKEELLDLIIPKINNNLNNYKKLMVSLQYPF